MNILLCLQTESLDERQKKNKLASQKPAAVTPPSLLKRSTIRPDNRPPKKIKTEGAKPDVPSAGKLNKLRGPPGILYVSLLYFVKKLGSASNRLYGIMEKKCICLFL